MSVYFPVDMKVEDNLLPLLSRLRYMGHGGQGQGELWGPTGGSFLLALRSKLSGLGRRERVLGFWRLGGCCYSKSRV